MTNSFNDTAEPYFGQGWGEGLCIFEKFGNGYGYGTDVGRRDGSSGPSFEGRFEDRGGNFTWLGCLL